MLQYKVFIAKVSAMILLCLCIGSVYAQSPHQHKIPPTAVNDSVLIGKNQSIEIDVLLNDTDPDGNINQATIQLVSSAQLGLVSTNNKKISYTPGTNVCGFDSVKYRVLDSNAELSNIATVYIEITCFNIAPIAKNDVLTIDEDKLDSIDVFDNDKYTDGPGIAFDIIRDGKNGHATINIDGKLRYQSNLNFNGLDTVLYAFCDLDPVQSLCDTAMVLITVNPINDPPLAINDTLITYVNQTRMINISSNDISIDGPSLDYSILQNPILGNCSPSVNGNFSYQAGSLAGKDSIKVSVCDLASPSLCDTSWLYINIFPVFQKPTIRPDTLRVTKNTTAELNILSNDEFPNAINTANVFISNIPSTGVFSYSDSVITYTPNTDAIGIFQLHYFVKDNIDSISNETSIVIIVNALPSSSDICPLRTIVNQSLLINPFVNSVQGTSAINSNIISIKQEPLHGMIGEYNTLSRSFKYTPVQDFVGNDSIIFSVYDVDGFESEPIKICIEIINDIPVSTNGTISPNNDGINDYLSFDNIDDFPNNEVIIFDRYWNEIFHTTSYSSTNFWNADLVNTGTYFYLVNISVNDTKKTIKGYITVLK